MEVESPPAITNCSPTTHNHTEVSPLHLQDTVYLQPLATFSQYEVGACNGSVRWNLTDGEAWRHDSLCGGVALSADRYGDVEFRGSFYPLDDDGDDEESPLSWDWSGFVFGYEDPGHFYIVLGPRNVETLETTTTTTTVATGCDGGDTCCTTSRRCAVGEGDCDGDWDCLPGLRCGVDNCHGGSFDGSDDCCYRPSVATTTPRHGLLGQ